MSKQLKFDFMKSDWEIQLDKLDNKDLNELTAYLEAIDKFDIPYSISELDPAYNNPCSSCPNNGKGPCLCTIPYMNNGPTY